MQKKIISSKWVMPLNFWKPDGSLQEMYGISLIYELLPEDIGFLKAEELLADLGKYGFEKVLNPHFTIVTLALQRGLDQQKFPADHVNKIFKDVKRNWHNDREDGMFMLDLADLNIVEKKKRNATRLFFEAKDPRIGEIRRKLIKEYPSYWSDNKVIDNGVNIHIGISKKTGLTKKDKRAMDSILHNYSEILFTGSLLIYKAKLVYHQNNFCYKNLKEMDLRI